MPHLSNINWMHSFYFLFLFCMIFISLSKKYLQLHIYV